MWRRATRWSASWAASPSIPSARASLPAIQPCARAASRPTASCRYLFEEPTSLNTLSILPDLIAAGVKAFKIEGRQRGRAYVGSVVKAFRRAVDAIRRGETPPEIDLDGITEGNRQTSGAYERSWR